MKAERGQRTNRYRTAEGINAYRVNSRTDNDVTYLGGVLKIEFREGKISRIASHSRNSRKFSPTKISRYTVYSLSTGVIG